VTETEEHTAVQIELHVEITAVLRHRRKEEFHAAVLTDAAQRRCAFRTDLGLPGALMDMDPVFIVADLLHHADTGRRCPRTFVHLQCGDRVPIGYAEHTGNRIFFQQ